jgi:hypothetical protein
VALRVEHVGVGVAVDEEEDPREHSEQHGHDDEVAQREVVYCRPWTAGRCVHCRFFLVLRGRFSVEVSRTSPTAGNARIRGGWCKVTVRESRDCVFPWRWWAADGFPHVGEQLWGGRGEKVRRYRL